MIGALLLICSLQFIDSLLFTCGFHMWLSGLYTAYLCADLLFMTMVGIPYSSPVAFVHLLFAIGSTRATMSLHLDEEEQAKEKDKKEDREEPWKKREKKGLLWCSLLFFFFSF